MDINLIKEDYVLKNLYREAKLLSRLFHPCIAALFQTMQFGNLYYLVMELVGGGDLCGFIKSQRNGRLEERCTRIYARQFVSAISHMHNVGIVHRDLKMENVMLNAIHTQIKIVDFGLSNIYTNSTPLRTHCGSPEYAAPELFVEGKHYGPEVDLWSLGVILYGMVIGQLPFANLRENALSAQERRTKLLVQINKGLSTTHRRALSLFSPEFKNMISKLLTPEPPKRITIKELIYHPWVTEKGRKSIRSNPMKKLDVQYQSVILKDAGSLLHLSLNEVEFAIRSEPQGSVAGIYNILAFRHTLRQMEGDGITRNLPEPDEIYTTPRPRAVVGKAEAKTCETKITSPSQRKELMKSAPITKFATPRTPVQTASVNKTCMKTPTKSSTEKSLKKRMIPKVLLSRLEKTNTAKPMPISDFVSPPKRSALSADEHKRSKLAENKSNSTNLTSHPISNILNLTRTPELLSPTSQGSPKVFSPKRKKDKHATLKAVEGNEFNEERSLKNAELRTVKLKLNKTTPKNTTTRTRSANGDIRPDLSPPTRRPLTGPIHTAERALKRRSLLPVMMSACTSHKDSAGTTTLATQLRYRKTQVLNKISDFHKQTPRLNENPEERAITPTKNQSARPMFEEPIARCITGYVVNNIPTKLSTFKWMKSTKKESS